MKELRPAIIRMRYSEMRNFKTSGYSVLDILAHSEDLGLKPFKFKKLTAEAVFVMVSI
jgi:hypothetical protein